MFGLFHALVLEHHFRDRMPARNTWRPVANCLDAAARGGDIASAVVAPQMVLSLERVPRLPQ